MTEKLSADFHWGIYILTVHCRMSSAGDLYTLFGGGGGGSRRMLLREG